MRRHLKIAVAVGAASVLLAPGAAAASVREYWVKAVNTTWDVAPNGGDPLTGQAVPLGQRTITAVVYRRYTAGWRRRMPDGPASADNDGIPGPLIEARVGDRVIVHFRNEDRAHGRPHSMHFHAFTYRPASDGAYIPFVSGRGAAVPVGGSFTYRLTAGPDSAGVWPYHDHSVAMTDAIARGLYGPIVILRRGERPPDRRFVVFLGSTAGYDTINGRAFIGNTPTFRARVGDRVEWNVLAIGEAFHVFHIHGHRWRGASGAPADSELIGPSSTLRIRFTEDAPGTWYYHCHVESHQMNGMIGLYRVRP
jgi:FtsP/CotA-like multicopper oxidase with cupredoxin domain